MLKNPTEAFNGFEQLRRWIDEHYIPYCNTDMFQIFLDEFSKLRKREYKIMFLGNGAFYKAKRLIIPENIGLIFLPP